MWAHCGGRYNSLLFLLETFQYVTNSILKIFGNTGINCYLCSRFLASRVMGN